jgi:hypothetical protein
MKFMLCQTLCFAVVVPVLGAHTLTPNQQRRCWKAGWRSTQAFDSRLIPTANAMKTLNK